MNISDLNDSNGIIRESFCSLEKLYEGVDDNDLEADFVLPDYLGDIKRIVSYDASPLIKGSYISGDEIEYDGEVIYTVIYVTAENMLRSVIFSEDFDGNVKASDYAEDAAVDFEPEIQNLTLRVTGPRKLTMKGKLKTSVRVMKKLCMEPEISGSRTIEDEMKLERRISEVQSAKILNSLDSDIKLSEEFELSPSEKSIEDIIRCDVSINISECKALKDKAMFKGTALVRCFYVTVNENGEEGYSSVVRSFPISNLSDLPACTEECACIAKAHTGKVRAEIIKNESGEGRGIKLDVTYDITMTCSLNEPMIVTEDIFSTEYECDYEYREREVTRYIKTVNTSFSANLSKSREELGASDAEEILFADVRLDKNRIAVEAGAKPVYNGEASVTVLYNTAGGEAGGCTFVSPVRLVLDNVEAAEDYECKLYAKVTGCTARSDKNEIHADIEVAVSAMIFAKEKRSSVITVNMYTDKRLGASKYPITLCYPEKGEGLWEIAKRYHVSLSSLSAANGISDGIVSQSVLVIPGIAEASGFGGIV